VTAGNVMRRGGQRYRKRRPLPAFLLILVLGIAATVVWLKVMNTEADVTGAAHCDPPGQQPASITGETLSPTTLGKSLEGDALNRTAPAAPGQVLVRVVNASSQRGQARLVTESLRALGFTQIGNPTNDAIYGESMSCRAQIRFGAQGTAAARTLSLLEPCAELIRDDRQDATVDMAIGEKFDNLHPNKAARTVFEQLKDWAKQNPQTQGGLQADTPGLELDANLLTAAHKVNC
jgi:hypothetical protein